MSILNFMSVYEIEHYNFIRARNIRFNLENMSHALFFVYSLSNAKLMKILINRGADVNLHNVNKETMLMMSCQNSDHIKISKLLIDHGADLDLQNNDGQTALMYACIYKNVEIVSYILEHLE